MIRLGRRRLEIGAFRDGRGELRLLVAFPTWEDFLVLAFDEIRFYGSTSIQVMRRMKTLVSELLSLMPGERLHALYYWRARLQSTVSSAFRDREDVLDAGRSAGTWQFAECTNEPPTAEFLTLSALGNLVLWLLLVCSGRFQWLARSAL